MSEEKRKKPRRPLRYPGTIDTEGELSRRPCSVDDVSETGARITTEHSFDTPDICTLYLSADRSVARQCKVVWRSEKQIGVEFIRNDA